MNTEYRTGYLLCVNMISPNHTVIIMSKCTYVVRVETFADRCHQVKLPVLLVVAHRVGHVVRIEPQNSETWEQQTPTARKTLVIRHDC